MAVSARFVADLTSLNAAFDKAEAKVESFGKTNDKVNRLLARFGDQLSGAKVVREADAMVAAIDRVGGVSTLTGRELQRAGALGQEAADKLRALGQDVPPKIQALANQVGQLPQKLSLSARAADTLKSSFGQLTSAFAAGALIDRAVTSLISMGREAFTAAGKTVDLAGKLGTSTAAIQRWSAVAKESGDTVEEFASAAFRLGTRLAGGSDSVEAAVSQLGLRLDTLLRMKPEERFDTVAGALSRMQDATERNRLGVEIFGKSFESIAGSVSGNYDRIARSAGVSGDAQIRALAEAGDAWDRLAGRIGARTVQTLGNFALITEELGKMFSGAGGGFAAALGRAGERARGEGARDIELSDPAKLTDVVMKATTAVQQHTQAQQAWIATTNEMNQGLQANLTRWATLAPAISDAAQRISAVRAEIQGTSSIMDKLFAAVPRSISSQGISQTLGGGGGLLGGLKGGFADLLKGFTGGGGLGGLLSGLGGGITKGLGNILSGGLSSLITSGLGLATKGLGALFGKLFGGDSPELKAAKQTFGALQREAATLGVTLDTTFGLKKVQDYERAILSAQGKLRTFNEEQALLAREREEDAGRLTAAIEKYGFTFQELGPAFRQQRLDEQAKELIEDWRVLVGSGIDLKVVNDKMSKSINEYLQLALKTGHEVPAAFRPILETLLSQGLLTDETGEKLKDLSKIPFAQTMTQGFDRVVLKLQELIDRLGLTKDEIDRIPRSIDIDVNYRAGEFPEPPSTDGPPQAQTGGFVARSGLAVIHRGETIVPAHRRPNGDLSGLRSDVQDLAAQILRFQQRLPSVLAGAFATTGR